MKKGFTLIELLVVVLIIGILSAVALPQYTRAVEKSRVSTMMPIARALADAQKLYYMANGEYATSFDDLDISLPGNCTIREVGNPYLQEATCGKIHFHHTSSVQHTQGIMKLGDGSSIYIEYAVKEGTKNSCGACNAPVAGQSNADKICKSMNPKSSYTSSTGCTFYNLD